MICKTTHLMPMYLIYLFDPLPNIEPPFLDDSIIWMLLMKLGKNGDSSRERSTTFLNGNNSITRRACFPSKYGLQLFTEGTNLITSFLEDIRIDGRVEERAINRFCGLVAEG